MSADTAYSAFLLHSKRVLLTINIAGNLEQSWENLSICILFLCASTEPVCFQFCSVVVLGWRQQTDFFFMWRQEWCTFCASPGTENISIFCRYLCTLLFGSAALLLLGLSGAVSSGQSWYSWEWWDDTENQRLMEYMGCLLQLRLTITPGERASARHRNLVHYCTHLKRKNPLEWRAVKVEKLKAFSPKSRWYKNLQNQCYTYRKS